MSEIVPQIDEIEAQERFYELLELVKAGARFDITRNGRVVGRLQGVQKPGGTRGGQRE